MAISKADMKMIGASAGLIAGGEITSKAGGDSPVSYGGAVAKGTGMLGLTYVGATELLGDKYTLTKAMMRFRGQQARTVGKNISSSARRAAPGLKLLAGKIAQGANKVI